MLSSDLLKPSPAAPKSRRLRRCAEGVSLWLAVLLMLFVHPLYAEAGTEAATRAWASTGEFRLFDGAGQPPAHALLLASEFDIRVRGLIADTRLSRRFQNISDQWREGIFSFPLPAKASVYGLTMKVGERTVVGRVRPKAEARKTYAAAKVAGHQATEVAQQRPNLFTARVANIPPGETIEVVLDYQQAVDYRAGEFELRLPTTLTPRYMPGQPLVAEASEWRGGWALPTTEVPDADAISPFTVASADLPNASHRARIRLDIDAGLPLARVFSPTHRLKTQVNGAAVQVEPATGEILMDRDLVVRWAPQVGQEPGAAVFHQRWQGEDYLMAMVVPGLGSDQVLARELVFVIDTSGSMAGASIQQAKEALQRGLDTLTPKDRFNIIQFNNQTHTLYPKPEIANGNNLARARRYVDRLHADGGTEMAPALAVALNRAEATGDMTPGRVRQVVFITDGAIGNEAALFQQIRRQLGNQRLFTVGIGSAPNRHFMREAARWGKGTHTTIRDIGDVAGPLATLFDAMTAPVLTDIATRWPVSGSEAEPFPARPGDLFQGEPLIQVVRGIPPAGFLELSGQLPGGKRWQRSVALGQAAPGVGLHRQWARGKIDSLLDGAHARGETPDKSKIITLAMAHSLMSPYTSFLAVEERPARPQETPAISESVPTLLPAGSEVGMLRYPQTATAGPLLLALGLAGLVLSAGFGLLQRNLKGRVSR